MGIILFSVKSPICTHPLADKGLLNELSAALNGFLFVPFLWRGYYKLPCITAVAAVFFRLHRIPKSLPVTVFIRGIFRKQHFGEDNLFFAAVGEGLSQTLGIQTFFC